MKIELTRITREAFADTSSPGWHRPGFDGRNILRNATFTSAIVNIASILRIEPCTYRCGFDEAYMPEGPLRCVLPGEPWWIWDDGAKLWTSSGEFKTKETYMTIRSWLVELGVLT